MALAARLLALNLGKRCISRVATVNPPSVTRFANAALKPDWLGQASTGSAAATARRCFAKMADDVLNKRLDTFQDLFVEARLCIDDVLDSVETTYFDDDAKAAQEAVEAAVNEFTAILNDIEDADQKNLVLRGNGLKVEQLKGELEMAIKGGHH